MNLRKFSFHLINVLLILLFFLGLLPSDPKE